MLHFENQELKSTLLDVAAKSKEWFTGKQQELKECAQRYVTETEDDQQRRLAKLKAHSDAQRMADLKSQQIQLQREMDAREQAVRLETQNAAQIEIQRVAQQSAAEIQQNVELHSQAMQAIEQKNCEVQQVMQQSEIEKDMIRKEAEQIIQVKNQ